MSGAGIKIVHPDSIHFATGHMPILELDGAVKHVELCGLSEGRADLLLIAPATANTISKIAHGIDDTVVTTMASCALGSGMPMVIVPAMHSSMYTHGVITENIEKLQKLDVAFVGPSMEENKAKMASQPEIVSVVCRALGPGDLAGKRLLVITGSTRERVDDVRCVTNYSTGRTGVEVALEAHRRGAHVNIWAGESVEIPAFLGCKRFSDVKGLAAMAKKAKADIIIVPAAISDFTVESRKGKLSSDKIPNLKLGRAPKVLEILRKDKNAKIVGFKAEAGITRTELEKHARARVKDSGIDLMVANLMQDVKEESTRALILAPGKKARPFKGNKSELAENILDTVTGC